MVSMLHHAGASRASRWLREHRGGCLPPGSHWACSVARAALAKCPPGLVFPTGEGLTPMERIHRDGGCRLLGKVPCAGARLEWPPQQVLELGSDWALSPQNAGQGLLRLGPALAPSAGHRFWLSLTGVHSTGLFLPGPSPWLRVSLFSPKSPILPSPSPRYACGADGSVRRLLGIPTSGLMPPAWEGDHATPCSPHSRRDRHPVDGQQDLWFVPPWAGASRSRSQGLPDLGASPRLRKVGLCRRLSRPGDGGRGMHLAGTGRSGEWDHC